MDFITADKAKSVSTDKIINAFSSFVDSHKDFITELNEQIRTTAEHGYHDTWIEATDEILSLEDALKLKDFLEAKNYSVKIDAILCGTDKRDCGFGYDNISSGRFNDATYMSEINFMPFITFDIYVSWS